MATYQIPAGTRGRSVSSGNAGLASATTPGRYGDDSARFGPRRARLPRSKSTSNMLDDISNLRSETTEEQLRNAVREQIDKDSLRALAEFLRTTGPPPDSSLAHDECFGFTGSRKKFSTGSLRRGKKPRWPSPSPHAQLPKSAVPEITTAGHRHIAITIPTPSDSHGPWFRSQYPVYGPTTPGRPTTSPAEWPERGSSRNAFTSRVQKQGSLGSLRRGPSVSSRSSSPGEVSSERSLSSLSITRPATAKPALNPVDESHEIPIAPQSNTSQSSSQRTTSTKSGYYNLAFRHPSLDFRFPTTNSTTTEGQESGTPAAVPKTLLHRRQLSRMSKKSKDFGTQNSRANTPEQPPEPLVVKSALAVPKASVQPESPGFPKMLAKMTFPSPPTTSRPSSRSNSVSSKSVDLTSLCTPITPPMPMPMPMPMPSAGPGPGIAAPVIQPRTTSKRACVSVSSTAPFSPSASLNEVMMRHAQENHPHQTETVQSGPPASADPSENPDTPTIIRTAAGAVGGAEMKDGPDPHIEPYLGEGPKQGDDVGDRSSGDLTPTPIVKPTTGRNSLESYTAVSEITTPSQRQSTSSNVTGTTTDTNPQSATTYNSFRSSTRSDTTASTFTTAKDGPWSPQSLSFYRDSAISNGPLFPAGGNEADATDCPTLGKGREGKLKPRPDVTESGLATDAGRTSPLRCSTPTSPASFIGQEDEDAGSARVVERSMARKARVHEYKQRDLNAVRTSLRASWGKLDAPSMDSPVLGWFPHENNRPRPQNPSPLAQAAPWSTTFEDAASDGNHDEQAPANYLSNSTSRSDEEDSSTLQSEPETQAALQKKEWTFSPIMVSAAIEAEQPEPPAPKCDLAVSDVIEIASIDPNTDAAEEERKRRQANRLSTLLLLESSPASTLSNVPGSRASLRPLVNNKSRPLSRSKPAPITISRNPKTGAIERTITPPKPPIGTVNGAAAGPYCMATPPRSSDSLGSPRRWSLPVHSLSPTPRTSTSWDRAPSPRRGGYYDVLEEDDEEDEADDERERDSRSRLDIVRERLQREKEEKEREINNIVARTVVPSPAPRISEDDMEPSEADRVEAVGKEGEVPNNGSNDNGVGGINNSSSTSSSNSVHEVERRLKRLEKNGDAWLRVMGPLLENMTKTLEAMQKDGIRTELKMSNFVVDMDAEARRYSMVSQNAPAAVKATPKPGSEPAATATAAPISSSPVPSSPPKNPREIQRSQSASPLNWGAKDQNSKKKRMGRGRSSSNLSRLRLQLDRATKRSIDETSTLFNRPRVDSIFEREGVRNTNSQHGLGHHRQTSSSASAEQQQQSQPPPTPGTPTDHDLQVEMAIRRRIKQQEAEFDALMNKWGMQTPRRAVFAEDDKRIPALPTTASVPGLAPAPAPASSTASSKTAASTSDEAGQGPINRQKRSGSSPRPLRLEVPRPRNSRSMNQLDATAMESPIDPMLRHVRRKSWPKPLPPDALGPLPPTTSVAAGSGTGGRRRSNTDLGPGGCDGTGVTRLMRGMGSASPLIQTSLADRE